MKNIDFSTLKQIFGLIRQGGTATAASEQLYHYIPGHGRSGRLGVLEGWPQPGYGCPLKDDIRTGGRISWRNRSFRDIYRNSTIEITCWIGKENYMLKKTHIDLAKRHDS